MKTGLEKMVAAWMRRRGWICVAPADVDEIAGALAIGSPLLRGAATPGTRRHWAAGMPMIDRSRWN